MLFLTNLCRRRINPGLSHEQVDAVKRYEPIILASLVEKLGDNLIKSRRAAEEALIAMGSNTVFTVTPVIDAIIADKTLA